MAQANDGASGTATHVPPDGGQTVWVMGETYTVKIPGEATGGAFAVVEGTVPPGLGTPPHVHHPNDETFYVLEGEAEFMAGGETVIARAGSIVHVPRGVLHNYRNSGATPARYLVMFAPAGFERMFLELGTPATAGAAAPPPDPALIGRLIAVAPSYGLEIPPPPGA